MNNPIGALTSQRQRLEQKAVALLEHVETLTADLTAAVGKQLITAVSDITNLDQYDQYDEYKWAYGKLHFGDGCLSVLYRYSGDDHEADHRGDDEDERPWRCMAITDCEQVWRERLMADAVLASLFKDIGEQLSKREMQIALHWLPSKK